MSLDDDLGKMSPPELIAEVKRLRAGIRKHRDAQGHNLCWYVPELWKLLPDKKVLPEPDPPPTTEFLEHCAAYRRSLDRGE